MEVALRPTFKANGMALDIEGNLVVCESVTSCLVRFRPGGVRELLAFHHDGRYLNSPNDVVVRRGDGGIYFTDPDYGRWNDWIGQERTRDLDFRAHLPRPATRAATVELLVDARRVRPAQRPVLLSRRDDALRQRLGALPRQGVRRGGRRHAVRTAACCTRASAPACRASGNVDGMECDELGNVWVTGTGGVWVLSPAGERLGVIRRPGGRRRACAGAAQDMHSLFLMTSTTVHVVETIVAPAPLPPA